MTETKKNNPVETLHSFMHRKTVQETNMAQEAQKLVNLFRHLNVFGDDFIELFNQQLLTAPKEVILLLPTVVGGSLVRQYLEFLTKKLGMTTEAEDGALPQGEDGYLPGPEDDIPLNASGQAAANGGHAANMSPEKAIEVLDKIISTQGRMFADTLEKITVETRQAASRQMLEIKQAFLDNERGYSVIEEKPVADMTASAPAPRAPAPGAAAAVNVDSVAAEMTPGPRPATEIPTVIDEQPPRAFVPRTPPVTEPEDDIEILSEIDLSNG